MIPILATTGGEWVEGLFWLGIAGVYTMVGVAVLIFLGVIVGLMRLGRRLGRPAFRTVRCPECRRELGHVLEGSCLQVHCYRCGTLTGWPTG